MPPVMMEKEATYSTNARVDVNPKDGIAYLSLLFDDLALGGIGETTEKAVRSGQACLEVYLTHSPMEHPNPEHREAPVNYHVKYKQDPSSLQIDPDSIEISTTVREDLLPEEFYNA